MARPCSVVIVDDEKAIRDSVVPRLIEKGYQVSAFSNGADALESLKAAPPDIIILDILMPRMDGIVFCKRWRSLGHQSIIIFLSSLESEESKVTALLSGGDDYLTKPFSVKELLVRIEVCIRRMNWSGERERASIPTSGLYLDEASWVSSFDGQEIVLTVSEFRILNKLYRSPGRVFTREQLIQAAYEEDAYISDRNADAHIKRIRKKLKEVSASDNCIETVYGVGYRMKK